MAAITVFKYIVILQVFISQAECYISCPRCTEAGNVRECLANTQECPGFMVCAGVMENFGVTVTCGFTGDCEGNVNYDKVNCTSGRPFSSQDRCHFCCRDLDSCRHQMTLVQQGIDGTEDVVHCPTCPEGTTDPTLCLDNKEPCQAGVKVCQVDWIGQTVSAGCQSNDVLCRLKESNTQAACEEEDLHEDAYCTRCCSTSECLTKALYITTTPATTTTTTTTTSPTTSTTTTSSTTTTTTPTTPTGTTTTAELTTIATSAAPTTAAATSATTSTSAATTPTTTVGPATAVTRTSVAPTVTTHFRTTAPSATASPTTAESLCKDNVKGDLCHMLPGVCQSSNGHVLCPFTCGFCDPNFPVVIG